MKSIARRAIIGLMSAGIVAAFAGTISGSIAWYAYSTRATVVYTGTSVSEFVQLQIGLVSEQDFTVDEGGHDRGFNLEIEDVPGESYDYYWAKAGSGFSYQIIQAFLQTENKYSSELLKPVTTRAYDGSSFNLFRAPLTGVPLLETNPLLDPSTDPAYAPKDSYSHIPFVFRVIDANGNRTRNASIWVTNAEVAASGENEHIREAVRLYFSEGPNEFLLNPTSKLETAGYTNVGGLLDLDNDGAYDTDEYDEEILYGNWKSTPTSVGTWTGENDFENPYVFEDVNYTKQEKKSTFVAEHRNGVEYYDRAALTDPDIAHTVSSTFEGTGINDALVTTATFNAAVSNALGVFEFSYDGTDWKLNGVTVALGDYGIAVGGTPAAGDKVIVTTEGTSLAETARFETFNSIKPNDDGNGNLTGGKPVARTTNDETAVARLDLTIFLEGWDHALIDEEINHQFFLGLRFQVNRV